MKVKTRVTAKKYIFKGSKLVKQEDIVKGEIVFSFRDKVKNLLYAIRIFFK